MVQSTFSLGQRERLLDVMSVCCGANQLRNVQRGIFGRQEVPGLRSAQSLHHLPRPLAFALGPLLLRSLPIQGVFWTPAAFMVVILLVTLPFLRESPEQAGLSGFDTGDEAPKEPVPVTALGAIRQVAALPECWILALCAFGTGFVNITIEQWYPRFMSVRFGVSPKELAGFAPYQMGTTVAGVAEVAGLLLAGLLSDRLFRGRRLPVTSLALFGQAVGLLLLWAALHDPWRAGAAVAWIRLCTSGALILVTSAAAMDLVRRNAVGTAMALYQVAVYLAGACSSLGLGRLLHHYRDPATPGKEFDLWPLWPLPVAVVAAASSALWWWRGAARRSPARASAG